METQGPQQERTTMFLQIPDVLNQMQLHHVTTTLDATKWADGKVCGRAVSEDLRNMVLGAVEATPRFISAALPTKVSTPQFYRNASAELPPPEVNKAVRTMPGSSNRFRSDLTVVIFLSDPATYEGGGLVVKNGQSEQSVKLPAGHMVMFSSGSRQELRPVTTGISFRCVLWVQSMIRDNGQRKILFDMDTAIQTLSKERPDDPSLIKLTGVYHNLLRYWAQV